MKKIIVIAAALAMMVGTAQAAEWNFYGSARVETFFTDADNGDGTSHESLSESLQGNSRIGAKVKVSDEVSGCFEYGASGGKANIRKLYGTWNFGAGSLMVGQDWSPLYLPVSNQVYATDNGLAGWGEADTGRAAQVKLTFGGFDIAIVKPDTSYYNGTKVVDDDSDAEVKIPAIEVRYKLSNNNWFAGIAAGYNTFEVGDYDIDSYLGMVSAGFTAGPFTLAFQASMGENAGNLVGIDVNNQDSGQGYAQISNGKVLDNEALGYEVVASYVINEMFSIEAGYGHQKTELDNAEEDEVCAYYFQAPITLAPGVYIVPEIGKVDYDEDTQGDKTYFGAKWQINF